MRVFMGPLTVEEYERLDPLPREHEVRFFGPDGPVCYQYGDRWAELLDRLPEGWWPDVVVWWSPEWRPWPVQDECPLPLVASVGDWNLNFTALREILGRCDYVVTDRAGVERLRALGYEHVGYWPNFAFNPRVHHRYPELPQQFDVLFIGNLNHDVQRRRARLLARLARLSDRYRVAILTNVYGEEYARALASSRIVVNRSIVGTMNMRAYEVPACGALLFMERENLEVGEYFRDGVECVLYGEDDFEALVERYLADESLRARVAAAGHVRVQGEDYAAHVERLLERLSGLDWGVLRGQRERWAALSPAERHYHSGRWLLQTAGAPHVARAELVAATRLAPDEPEYANAVAVVEALVAGALRGVGRGEEAERYAAAAEARWGDLLARWPEHALGWANLGLARLAWGDGEGAERALREALGLLRALPGGALEREGCLFVRGYDTLRVEWERVVADHVSDVVGMLRGLKGLLRWECAWRLGQMALGGGQVERAREMFEVAVEARPDLEAGYAGCGVALERLSRWVEAEAAYVAALERQPWDFGTRRRLALMLYLVGEEGRCAEVCREGVALARACPHYKDAARPLRGLMEQMVGLPVGAA